MSKKSLSAALAFTAAVFLYSGAAFAGDVKGTDGTESYWWVNGVGEYGYTTPDDRPDDGGWFWIDGNGDGTAECYYFVKFEIEKSNCGLQRGVTTPDGYTVNEAGEWTVDGKVQTRDVLEGGCYVSYYCYNFGEATPDTPLNEIPLADGGAATNKCVGYYPALIPSNWISENTEGGAVWRYRQPNGTVLRDEWELIDGKWYYFDKDGAMLAGGVTPDGYEVGADGAWTGK